ncbi:MAG: adenine nucleotide alpha hydrolase [Alphaproteobacteria bacterium]|nr:adenine nucleotide alpha hydrolase [Alphaproteobacteria bacterium]
MKPRAVLFWSGGKDSGLALDRLRRAGDYEIAALITTVNAQYGRVSMHGVREELVAAQARAAGLPLDTMYVGPSGTNEAYVASLRKTLAVWRERGIETVAFGDIFLADLRQWRESLLAELGLHGVFPLWHADTTQLAQEFVARGFRAVLCCANDAMLGEADVGRALDTAFFTGLPAGVDPCGENGEYHSFVWDGPVFHTPVAFKIGEKLYRPLEATPATAAAANGPMIPVPAAPGPSATKGFWFVDLLPA